MLEPERLSGARRRCSRSQPGFRHGAIVSNMPKRSLFTGKVYRQPKPGEGLQPGTVDWELARRQARTQRRREDKAFDQRMAETDELEPKGFWRVFDAIVGFFRIPN
jgi:hypothetical protein